MNDRTLLELAAKVAGINDAVFHGPIEGIWSNALDEYWNPLTDDGDALRLAVKLGVMCWRDEDIIWGKIKHFVLDSDDLYAATRRAIVCAAAEIGKGMP